MTAMRFVLFPFILLLVVIFGFLGSLKLDCFNVIETCKVILPRETHRNGNRGKRRFLAAIHFVWCGK